MQTIKYITVAFLLIFVIISCDFEKIIDMPEYDSVPKLAVSSILDTDSGRFTLSIFEALSLSHYKDWKPISRTVIRDGEIRLFEDDNLILQLDGPFDLSSNRQYPEDPSVNDFHPNGYHYKKTGVSAVAGRTYRLEAEIDGYEMVTATTIMPDAPVIGEIKTDTVNIVHKDNIASFYSLGYGYGSSWSNNFIITDVSLTDNSTSPDYYVIQQRIYTNIKSIVGEVINPYWINDISVSTVNTGISNPLLVQDNPDYESQMGDIFGESESYDLYLFDLFVMSDFTFANSNIDLKLHAGYNDFFGYGNQVRLSDYNLETDGAEVTRSCRFDVMIKHISPETYKHYQSMALQLTGVDFFTEPVNIVSNVKNGYGCFSACNSHVTSMEYECYSYPDKQIYYEY